MKRLLSIYINLIGLVFAENPFIVIAAFVSVTLTGCAVPVTVWVTGRLFCLAPLVASGDMAFQAFSPYLALFVVLTMLPVVAGDLFLDSYVQPNVSLILKSALKGRMLQKLKKMRYEHLENVASMEIIDKTYNRAEQAAPMLFPYNLRNISKLISVAGVLYLLASARWWLPLAILLPFALETWLARKHSANIYGEMEKYWKDERMYTMLGTMLRTREYIREIKLSGASGFLIDMYRRRLNKRNREYERFFLTNIKRIFARDNITRLTQAANVLILLFLYVGGGLNLGQLVSLSAAVIMNVFSFGGLAGMLYFVKNMGFYINTFEYYDLYFGLSEDEHGDLDELPDDFTIEFDNVRFRYPGTRAEILKGLTFSVGSGEKISIVGRNGEGKTTMIKLLLGLFRPDSGEIRVGGKPLGRYTQAARRRLFGPVFQDFARYSISFAENVGAGDAERVGDREAVAAAMRKAKADAIAEYLPDGADTLLGRDFEGGVDLSGGQWQRVAIARAFMGDKPILILDEPTSQLDPMAESLLYSEFMEVSEGRTAIFITHRLGSTVIADRIVVVEDGRVAQSGTHGELMERGGLYAEMFNAQKQWYIKDGEEARHA